MEKPDILSQISLSRAIIMEISLSIAQAMIARPFINALTKLPTTLSGIFALEIMKVLAAAGDVVRQIISWLNVQKKPETDSSS